MNEIVAIEQLIRQVSSLDRVEEILREVRHGMNLERYDLEVGRIIQRAINRAINKRVELLEDYWRKL